MRIVNFRRMMPIIRKEFLHIIRDSRSLVVVIAAPVVMLFLYGYAVTFDIKKIDLVIVDQDKSALSRELARKFGSSGYFELHGQYSGRMGDAVSAMRVNRARVIMTVPYSFSRDIKANREARIQLLIDGSESSPASIAVGYAGTIISEFSRNITLDAVRKRGFNPKKMPFVEPVPRVWYNPELKSVNFVVPGLIAIIMMAIAALLTSLTVIREKERGTFEQLISTPVKSVELMAGKLAPYVVIGLCDVAIIVAVGTLWFGIPLKGSIVVLFVFSLVFIFCALGIGLVVSSIAQNQQTAVIGTAFSTILPSVLLSGFIFPIKSMPLVIQLITYLVPARYFLSALRSIFLKADVDLVSLFPEFLYLLFFGILFLAISAVKFRKKLE
ncbi:MAG: ABC transporter permease [Endomicrobiales bacterium]|nr:ABC transporter permease [Endomicrobiales bacterium]